MKRSAPEPDAEEPEKMQVDPKGDNDEKSTIVEEKKDEDRKVSGKKETLKEKSLRMVLPAETFSFVSD